VRLRVADERLGERGRRVRAHVAEADDLGFITEPPARREREHAARAFALGRVRRGHHVERGGLDLAGHTHIEPHQFAKLLLALAAENVALWRLRLEARIASHARTARLAFIRERRERIIALGAVLILTPVDGASSRAWA
jgi:hypothetical protein